MRTKLKKYLLGLLFVPCTVFAWNMNGHVMITDMAQTKLSNKLKANINVLAQGIFIQLSAKDQRFLIRRFPNMPAIARLSVLPDWWKQEPLGMLFKRFHAPLPQLLKPYAKETTASWHFINHPYPAKRQCDIIKPENVVWAINLLQKAYQSTDNANTKGLILIFLAHFVGDAHQPLHTLSYVNARCQSDYGGNAFCLTKKKHGRCRYNLHEYWDSTMGEFKGYPHIGAWEGIIKQASNPNLVALNQQAKDLNPAGWARHNKAYAAFIYSAQKYHLPSKAYKQKAQKIAYSEMRLASLRLAKVLRGLVAKAK